MKICIEFIIIIKLQIILVLQLVCLAKFGITKEFKIVYMAKQVSFLEQMGRAPDGYKWVYIIYNPAWPNFFKVGVASNLTKRLNSYQTGSPLRDYQILYAILSKNWFSLESDAQSKFRALFYDKKGVPVRMGGGEWCKGDIEKAIAFLKINADFYKNDLGKEITLLELLELNWQNMPLFRKEELLISANKFRSHYEKEHLDHKNGYLIGVNGWYAKLLANNTSWEQKDGRKPSNKDIKILKNYVDKLLIYNYYF